MQKHWAWNWCLKERRCNCPQNQFQSLCYAYTRLDRPQSEPCTHTTVHTVPEDLPAPAAQSGTLAQPTVGVSYLFGMSLLELHPAKLPTVQLSQTFFFVLFYCPAPSSCLSRTAAITNNLTLPSATGPPPIWRM